MSTNKVLALVGSIISSIFLGFTGLIYLFLGFVMVIGSTGYYGDGEVLAIGVIMIFFSLLALLSVLFNWIAFAKMDKQGEGTWKIYFLVMGILYVISIVSLIPGVLFILVFALKNNNQQDLLTETVSASPLDEGWAEIQNDVQTPSSFSASETDAENTMSAFESSSLLLASNSESLSGAALASSSSERLDSDSVSQSENTLEDGWEEVKTSVGSAGSDSMISASNVD